MGNFVYENNVLQFFGHQEGRIRNKPASGSTAQRFVYDYFLKDHLGNVSMVLTDKMDESSYPAATLETASIEQEKTFYHIPDATSVRVNKNTVPGYPADTYTSPNYYVQKLSGSGTKVGSSMALKVMAGDKVNIRASSWYKLSGTTEGSQSPVSDILLSLADGIAKTAGGAKGSSLELQQSGLLTPGVGDFLTHRTTQAGVRCRERDIYRLKVRAFHKTISGQQPGCAAKPAAAAPSDEIGVSNQIK